MHAQKFTGIMIASNAASSKKELLETVSVTVFFTKYRYSYPSNLRFLLNAQLQNNLRNTKMTFGENSSHYQVLRQYVAEIEGKAKVDITDKKPFAAREEATTSSKGSSQVALAYRPKKVPGDHNEE